MSIQAINPISEVGLREIPYNYTSYTDKEIVIRYLGESSWRLIESLRVSRQTGQSARMLFEVLGDMWVIERNPYIEDDLLNHTNRRELLFAAISHRISAVEQRLDNNQQACDLVQQTRLAVKAFSDRLDETKKNRKQVEKRLYQVLSRDSVSFDGLARVSHSTDATDWRVEYPLVVLTPETEQQVMQAVLACTELGLNILPRGGGTGYTGSAVPLRRNCAVINTEKLDQLQAIEYKSLNHQQDKIGVIRVGAGVVTRRVSDAANKQNLIFAVDPTSQDASTIGGNIAMNAGGKKAVLWGTTLDNLYSWRLVTPSGEWLEVTRLAHNLGKIHDQNLVEFECEYFHSDGVTPSREKQTLLFEGSSLRKEGLGKDVTDKFLGGLPGVQKEGCDGLITSAEFVLHQMPDHTRTVCLEFYGSLHEAVPAIVEAKAAIDNNNAVYLAGLEHLDHRYIKAVGYASKAAGRSGLPKMLLVGDITGHNADEVAKAASTMVEIASRRNGEGFVAVSAEARKQFWADRSRTAAIAAHTNAFKINEDVVIPLTHLATYSEEIERINITQSIKNKQTMLAVLQQRLSLVDRSKLILSGDVDNQEHQQLIAEHFSLADKVISSVRERWSVLYQSLEKDAVSALSLNQLTDAERAVMTADESVFSGFLDHRLKVSWRREVEKPLKQIFSGAQYALINRDIDQVHQSLRPSRLFVALHAHAGDGNVHSNIPVNSHDYDMMKEADLIVDQIMALATKLDGVISGEHGIGMTKIKYIEPEALSAFYQYKNEVDPNNVFNPGKLTLEGTLDRAYTPSFSLLKQESLLLEASELGELNDSIKSCLRCGKCKPVCTTHVPRANLLYSPRNKILATGLLIEAFLYEEQTRRGIALSHFDEMNDVADHCTVCHRCLSPCPVNIDFGNVSIHLRRILKNQGKRRKNIGTTVSMAFLNAKDPATINVMRKTMIDGGYQLQRFAHDVVKKLPLIKKQKKNPRATTTPRPIPEQVVHFVNRKLPSKKLLPTKPLRGLLGVEDSHHIPILRDPLVNADQRDSVFYFPGCGSERLFSQVGLATLAMLYDAGAQTVLPPGYLCCGYPQASSGEATKSDKMITDNRVLFHRVATTLNYMDIKTVLVSCGTCMDQLLKYEFEQIFPGCRLLDIHEYLQEKGYSIKDIPGKHYIYHDPCHSPIKQQAPINVARSLLGDRVVESDRCCGEAGTFAVNRPDIATQVRFRKAEELEKNQQEIMQLTPLNNQPAKMLTSCPACLQGLSRFSDELSMEADYIVVELAKHILGEQWMDQFVKNANQGGTEKVLL